MADHRQQREAVSFQTTVEASPSTVPAFQPRQHQQYLTRRLQFEYGASISFKLCYSIIMLTEGASAQFTIEERLANLYDANTVLLEAHDILSCDEAHDRDLLENFAQILQLKLDTIRKDIRFQTVIQQKLLHFQSMLTSPVTDVVLEEWHEKAVTFMRDMRVLSDVIDIKDELVSAHRKVDAIYAEFVRQVENDETLITTQTSGSAVETIDWHQIQSVEENLVRMGAEKGFDTNTVDTRLTRLFQVYDWFYQMAKRNKSDRYDNLTLQHFSDAGHIIRKELTSLLGHFGTETPLIEHGDDHSVTTMMDQASQGACHALVSKAGPLVQSKLSEMFDNLQQAIKQSPDMSLEHDFTALAKLIFNLSMPKPAGIMEGQWIKYAAQFLTPTESQQLLNNMQCTHTSFQTEIYGREETSALWLAIWRGLKTMYIIARGEQFTLQWPEFPAEVEFFKSITVRNQFELIMSGPDALHPEVIENVVGDYCILIAKCQASTHHSFKLLQLIKPSEVKDWVYQTISEFTTSQQWCHVGMRSVQKCAIRLNHNLQGPTFIRRMDPRGPKFATGCTAEWKPEPASAKSIQSASSRSSSASRSTAASRPSRSQTSTATSTGSALPKQQQLPTANTQTLPAEGYTFEPIRTAAVCNSPTVENPDSAMGGVPVVSAFDYVIYPFPETRAVEVAQSRQISRELSAAGIYSQGALPQDVINRPPRHVWPPGAVSIWAKPIPIGPVSIVRDLWSSWRRGRPARRLLQQPRPHPRITQRTPRKDWVDQHPRLRPLYDSRHRAGKHAKTASDPAQGPSNPEHRPSNAIRVPKLRGGAPRSANGSQASNPTNTGVTAPMHERLHQLMDRIQGFWRGGDQPAPSVIRDRFLIPNEWDVDMAYDAIREFLNRGVLDNEPHRPNQTHYQNIAQSDSPPPIGNDPFAALGVVPGVGLDPLAYGLPIVRPPTGAVASSPTPQPRRRLSVRAVPELDAALPAQYRNPEGSDDGRHILDRPAGDMQIYVDDIDRTPGSQGQTQATVNVTAGNLRRQAPRDRQRLGLPPRQPGDNRSSQENISPSRFSPNRQTPTPSTTMPDVTMLGCDTSICHPCPVYTGLFHHLCSAQQSTASNIQVPSSPNHHAADSFFDQLRPIPSIESFFGLGALPPSASAPARMSGQTGSAPQVFDHSQDSIDGTMRSPPSSFSRRQIIRNTDPQFQSMDVSGDIDMPTQAAAPAVPANGAHGPTSERQQSAVSTPPTVVGGHRLRNRNGLVQQRTERTYTPDVQPAAPTTVTGAPQDQSDTIIANTPVSAPVPTPASVQSQPPTQARARARARRSRRRRASHVAFTPQSPNSSAAPATPATLTTPASGTGSALPAPSTTRRGTGSTTRRRRAAATTTATATLRTPRRRTNTHAATGNGNGTDGDSDAGDDYTIVTPMGGTEPTRRVTRGMTKGNANGAGTV